MGCKVKVNSAGYLAFRLFWNRIRSWEGTHFKDTAENRRLVQARSILIEAEMKAGIFNYLKWFPHGNRAHLFERAQAKAKPMTIGEYFDQWIKKKTPPLI